jgi:branched-chain amino acid transport system ATP-binding protein
VLLRARKLDGGYNGAPVVHGIDLTVDRGEVVALLGPNGAGKTTTLMTLAGELAPIAGDVELDDHPTTQPLHRRARAGVSFVSEERAIFRRLTPAQNFRVAGVEAADALELFPELQSRLKVPAGLLSGGEQQMLALAWALARRPRLLLADELSLGLAPRVVRRLLGAVRSAANDLGVGVLLVEQHVAAALAVADRAYVMRRGRIEIEGPTQELRERIDEIEASYLSTTLEPTRANGDGPQDVG